MKIEHHKTFKVMLSLLWKMPICPQKVKKGAKVGRAVGKNQLFCILLKIGSLDFFHVFHKVIEAIKAYKLPHILFFRKILIFHKKWKKGSENRQIALIVGQK